jgi:Ser/Thr protein kinase RdoA (MazF antagonist)
MTGGNALMIGQRVAALIDFGLLSMAPRTADLAAAIFWALFFERIEDPLELAWQQARRCIAAYQNATNRSVTDEETTTLAIELARLPAAGVAVSHREADPGAEIVAFGRALSLAQRLVENVDDAAVRLRPAEPDNDQ